MDQVTAGLLIFVGAITIRYWWPFALVYFLLKLGGII